MPVPWSNIEQPPEMISPVTYDISQISPTSLPATGLYCSGDVTRINITNDNEDAYVIQSSPSNHTIPVQVTGGRNVQCIGLQIVLDIQNGCEAGALGRNNPPGGVSRHPRIPGGSALRMQQYRYSWVEGCLVDMTGHEADAATTHVHQDQSTADTTLYRHFMYINSCIRNWRSDKDAQHGDALQNRDGPTANRGGNRIRLENVDLMSIGNGMTIHGGAANPTPWAIDYVNTWFTDGDSSSYPPKNRGLMLDGGPVRAIYYDNLYNNFSNGTHWFVGPARHDAGDEAGTIEGAPPGGRFAPDSDIGVNYNSPFATPGVTPFDTRAKRAAVLGVARPWMRSKYPDATMPEAWRMATGNTYGRLSGDPNPFQVAWVGSKTTTIVGGS